MLFFPSAPLVQIKCKSEGEKIRNEGEGLSISAGIGPGVNPLLNSTGTAAGAQNLVCSCIMWGGAGGGGGGGGGR
jgi:hypothetical protein